MSITLRELITDVLANPTQYTDAFPVAESPAIPQSMREWANTLFPSPPSPFTEWAQQQMAEMARLVGPPLPTRFHETDVPLPPRPDHYRVRHGQCACGYTSMFSSDMDQHVGAPDRNRRYIVHNARQIGRTAAANSYNRPPTGSYSVRTVPARSVVQGNALMLDRNTELVNGEPISIDPGTLEMRDAHGRTVARITGLDTEPELPRE